MGSVDEQWRDRLLAVYPSLRRFAAVVGSADMAPDDLVHDAIVSALRGGGLERADDLEAYLRRAIVNGASNERRRLGRHRSAVARQRDAASDGALDAYPSDLGHLAALPATSRAVLFLHYVEGRSFEEIAGLLAMRSDAVRQAAHRARRQLQLNVGGIG
jgi:DNA-directed RNA polymerase specialized sigma24 family protein